MSTPSDPIEAPRWFVAMVIATAAVASLRAIDLVAAAGTRGARAVVGELGAVATAAAWWCMWRGLRGPSTDRAIAGVVGLGALAAIGLLGSLPLFRGLAQVDELPVALSIGVRLLALSVATVTLVSATGLGIKALPRVGHASSRARPGRLISVVGATLLGGALLLPTTAVGDSATLRPLFVDADPVFAAVTVSSAAVPLLLVLVSTRLELGAAAWLVGATASVLLGGLVGQILSVTAPTRPTVWLFLAIAGAVLVVVAARWWVVLDRSARAVSRRTAVRPPAGGHHAT